MVLLYYGLALVYFGEKKETPIFYDKQSASFCMTSSFHLSLSLSLFYFASRMAYLSSLSLIALLTHISTCYGSSEATSLQFDYVPREDYLFDVLCVKYIFVIPLVFLSLFYRFGTKGFLEKPLVSCWACLLDVIFDVANIVMSFHNYLFLNMLI